ncbi:MAG TPA: lipopolysaccharide kinase InaA family protein, partial [Urbifossiella sp.]
MPVETLSPVVELIPAPAPAPLGARLLPESCGWVEFHPRFRERLAAQKLLTAEAFLELRGEIVSGHPDRHALRIELPGWENACYLKRQHRVGLRERFRQWRAGFGWSSRSVREARMLRELEKAGLSGPRWIAFGEDGAGQAFLLVEELPDAVNLRELLSDNQLSLSDRSRLAERLGQAVAELHAAGFHTPDLTAKHVFVNPDTFVITLVDWQSARRGKQLSESDRMRFLVGLDASLGETLAGRRERFRFLWAYRRIWVEKGRFSETVREIERQSARSQKRRSIRDQRHTPVTRREQRLVWLAGEAVCAIPEVAAAWPKPAIAPPFYTDGPADKERLSRVRLPDGREVELLRGQSFEPLGRLFAAIRGKSWRSAGVMLGRVLFHLQRYGIPAPRLYAFGQRDTGPFRGDWFILYEPPTGRPLAEWLKNSTDDAVRRNVLEQASVWEKQLSEAGCCCRDEESPF